MKKSYLTPSIVVVSYNQVDIYAVFTGTSEEYYQLTILTEDWIKDVPVKATEELTSADIIREVALSYYRQNEQIQYNQKVSMRNINAKPEDATSQHLTYLDCSSFVGAVIKEALGIEIIPDEVVGTYITETNKYNLTSTYPQTGRFATYANHYAGNPDYPDIIKFVSRSEMNTDIVRLIEEYNLSIGDIIVAEFDLYNNTSSSAVKTGNIVHVIYVYVGNSQLVCLTDDVNHVAFTNGTASAGATVDKCFTITISNNARKDTHTLTSIFTYDRWVVLHPSLVA